MSKFDDPNNQSSSETSETEVTLTQRVSRLEKQLEETLLLLSDVYRYGKLRDFLAAGNFKEADQETTRIMLEVAGKASKETLTPDDVMQFPCDVIRVIDQLWKRYSDDRFGFSIQLELYQSVGGNLNTLRAQNAEILQKLAEKLGRRRNNQVLTYEERNFNLSDPVGSLPAHWWNSPYGIKMVNYFLTRLLACNL